MRCRKFKKRIEIYLDGGIGSAEKAVFEAHSRQCTSCAGLLREAKEDVLLYKEALSSFRLRESLKESVISRLHSIPAVRRERSATGELKKWEIISAAATAAALFIFSFCASMWLTAMPEQESSQPEAVSREQTSSALVEVYWKVEIAPYCYWRGAEFSQEATSGG